MVTVVVVAEVPLQVHPGAVQNSEAVVVAEVHPSVQMELLVQRP